MKTIIQKMTLFALLLLMGDVFAQPPTPPAPPAGQMLDVWTFAGTNYQSFRRVAPLSLTNAPLVPTWDGNGLQMDSTNAAWITYPVSANGHVELSCSNGSWEVWLSPDWNSADGLGVWGTILGVGTWSTNLSTTTGAWGLFISPNGSNLFFSAQTNSTSTNYLYAPISWSAGEWHQIVLTYSATNSALYLDGQLATNGPGMSIVPGADALTNGFSIGSDGLGTGLLQSRSTFNQLITYNYELDADTISNNYDFDSEFVPPLSSGGFHLNTLTPPDPPGGGGTNSGSGGVFDVTPPTYTTNDFWIQALPPGTNAYNADPSMLTLLVHGTTNTSTNMPIYELLWTDNLTPPVFWEVMEAFLGTTNTNVTALNVPLFTDVPAVFFKAVNVGTNGDSEGIGIPDAWQRQYFGYVGIDPYANPKGDGYNNLYKYQHGMNPNTFYTPAAPAGVTAVANTNGNILISWLPAANLPTNGAGAVTGYTLQIQSAGTTNYVNIASNQFSYQTASSNATYLDVYTRYPYSDFQPPHYSLQIQYAHTNSAWTPLAFPFDPSCSVNGVVARGNQGALYLIISAVPVNVQAVRITWMGDQTHFPLADDLYATSYDYTPPVNSFETNGLLVFLGSFAFDVPISSFSNGIYQIPQSQASLYGSYNFSLQGIGANGNLGSPVYAVATNDWNGLRSYFDYSLINIPFLDGRTNIAQNINFLLRAADLSNTFQLLEEAGDVFSYGLHGNSNYVYSGYYFGNDYLEDSGTLFAHPNNFQFMAPQRNEFEPFEESAAYRQFVCDFASTDGSGTFTNSVSLFGYALDVYGVSNPAFSSLAYDYVNAYPTNFPASNILPVLDTETARWIVPPLYEIGPSFPEEGCTENPDIPTFTLPSGVRNLYGLYYDSIKYYGTNNAYDVASPNVAFEFADGIFNYSSGLTSDAGWFHEVDQPSLSTVGYYFARPGIDPVPGQTNFAVTNATSDLIFAPWGKHFFIGGWAKQSVVNGYSGVYAYPQQYFDKAFLADTNGNITTNQTGILSEYGDFFPTQPGKVFLTTKADAATGTLGTNVVNVIKLQLDVNHDGIMDTTFAGPDNTSAERPFEFWVNDDNDGTGIGADIDISENPAPADYAYGEIRSQRNLEDFARLWICGLPKLPTADGYTATLSISAINGNPSPSINLYAQYDTNGGVGYLTDPNAAAQQVASPYGNDLARITSTQNYNLPVYGDGSLKYSHFLFEGAGIGSGRLTLTISKNSNVLCVASAYLEFHDVKDFFEHARSSDVALNDPPTTNTGAYSIDSYQVAHASSENKEVIVFVHGINNTEFVYENANDTIFKRLYWQGYNGRYAAFRWPSPTWSLMPTSTNQIGYLEYNKGEYIGWQSGAGFKHYVDNLRARFPDYTINVCATSGGGVVASEGIRLGAQVDNYAMVFVSLPAESFDGNNTNLIYDYLASGGALRPDADALGGYNNCFTNSSTRFVNFYNDDDFANFIGALHVAGWEQIQLHTRPDRSLQLPGWDYYFDGTNCFYENTDENGLPISTRMLTQDYEKKSYVARSRTKAIGAAGLKYPPYALAAGVISTNISVQNASLGFVGGAAFGKTRSDHSGEFMKSVQNSTPFYFHLLKEGFHIQPAINP